jgi:hypothetical protein
MTKRPPITHVAIRFLGKVHSLPAPNRHSDVIRMIIEADPTVGTVNAYDDNQGFLDADGLYLNRRQALYNAQVNNQIKPGTTIRAGRLFSEDVW